MSMVDPFAEVPVRNESDRAWRAQKDERERCAKIAEHMANNWARHQLSQLELGRHELAALAGQSADAARQVAAMIRQEEA
jgi:hypothetical protein